MPYLRDLFYIHVPMQALVSRLLAQGQPPWWNPYLHGGFPLAADVNNNVFYPGRAVFHVLPLASGLVVFELGHYLLAGAGTYLLLRTWRVSRLPATLGAVVFMLSGCLLSLHEYLNILPGAAWLPWVLALLGRAVEPGGVGWLVPASMVLALLVVTEPQNAYLAMSLAGLWVIAGPGAADPRRLARGALGLGGAAALALLLSAVQTLPLLELYSRSVRLGGLSLAESASRSLAPFRLIELLAPGALGDPLRMTYWGWVIQKDFGAVVPWLLGVYVGAGTLALAGVALVLGRRDGIVRFCGLTAVLATLLAAGPATPLYGWAYRVLPLFSLFRYPSKWFLAATLALAALAALGLDRLGARDPADERLARRLVSVVLVIVLALAAGLVLLILRSDLVVAKLAPQFPTAGLQLAASALDAITRSGLEAVVLLLTTWLLLAVLVWTRGSAPVIQGLLLVVLTVDLVLHNARLVPLGPPALLEAEPDLARALTADPDLFRVHREEVTSRGESLPPGSLDLENPTLAISWEHWRSLHENLGMPYGLQAFRGHTSARLGDFDRMLERFAGRPDYPRLLGLWNVKYMIAVGGALDTPSLEPIALPGSDDRIHLYRNRALGPRAWWVPRARRVPDHARALDALTDLDPAREVLLEEPVASGGEDPSVSAPAGATVTVARYAPLEVLVECRAPAPGFLVLADTYYPGWRATVDARESPVLRANYAMRAVAVPTGSHTVRFRYEPRAVQAGALITGASLVGWIVLGGAALRRRRRAERV